MTDTTPAPATHETPGSDPAEVARIIERIRTALTKVEPRPWQFRYKSDTLHGPGTDRPFGHAIARLFGLGTNTDGGHDDAPEEVVDVILECVNGAEVLARAVEDLQHDVAAAIDSTALMKEMTYKQNDDGSWSINAAFAGDAIKVFAGAMIEEFRKAGGSNYVEMEMIDQHPDPAVNAGRFVLTIQRKYGKTPATLKREADERCDAVIAACEDYFKAVKAESSQAIKLNELRTAVKVAKKAMKKAKVKP